MEHKVRWGESDTPASLLGPVDGVYTWVIRAPGGQMLAKGLTDHLGFLNFSLETGDDQQVSAIFEISAECTRPAPRRPLHPGALRKCL